MINNIIYEICTYAAYYDAGEEVLEVFQQSSNRCDAVSLCVQKYFLNYAREWNLGLLLDPNRQKHVFQSRQMILEGFEGQLKRFQSLPKGHSMRVAIFAPSALEPCAQIAAHPQVSKVYIYDYSCLAMAGYVAGLTSELRAKFELIQIDLSGGLFECLSLIFSLHKDPRVLKSAYHSLCEHAEQISLFPAFPKVDYVICSLLLTQVPMTLREVAKVSYGRKFGASLVGDPQVPFLRQMQRRLLDAIFEAVVPGGTVFLSDTWELQKPKEARFSFDFPIQEELWRFRIAQERRWLMSEWGFQRDGSSYKSNTTAFLLKRPA